MDAIIATNRERWNALAAAHVMHSVPFFDYTREDAAAFVYRHDFIAEVAGKRVLCLAGGGGQDSVAFTLLGAQVTVLDLSDTQRARDREGAEHHGLHVETVQGDMRDLSLFSADAFDVVWQPYALNYCPEVAPVFSEIARVLRADGLYYLMIANPLTLSIANDWEHDGYRLRGRDLDGEDIRRYYPPEWEVAQADGSRIAVPRPHEFRHTVSTVVNTLAQQGFHFLHLTEWMRPADPRLPGSWPHFTQRAPPYLLTYWQRGAKA
jgi:SAM-dependent methyltransferase